MNNKEVIDSIINLSNDIANIDGKLSILIPKIESLDKTQDEMKEKIAIISSNLSSNKSVREFSFKVIGIMISISALISGITFSIIKLLSE